MIEVSNDYKLRTKKIKQQNIKLGIVDGELTVKEVHFMTVKQFNAFPVSMLRKRQEVIAKELKYSFEGSLFKTIMKQIEITVKNAGELKDKNVNFKYGLYVNNDYEYVDLGDYYIKDIEDNKGKSELVVTGYDKMINFMKIFKQSDLQLTYPCTMLSLVQRMCEICGVELYSMYFFNSDLNVDEDYFTVQELTYRDVLEKVAQSTLTTIFIKDNKLYLHKLANNVEQKLDSSYLTGLTVKEKFGPLNALVLGRGEVEDNVEAKDDTSIAQNGRCEIRFDENEFVEYQREKVIDNMFEQINGLEYYSFEGSDVGVMWLEPCDLIEVEDSENSTYKTIYLSANITINTGISSDIEADILEETNTEYKVTTKEEKKTLKVERLAKKNEGLIQDLVEETTEQEKKTSQLQIDVDSIKGQVGKITGVTTTEEGNGSLEFTGINTSEPILVKIHPTVEDITPLRPKKGLYPRKGLYPHSREIIFKNTTNNSIVEYNIPKDLYKLDNVYDEFVLDYENQQCYIRHRIGLNSNKEKYLLDVEKVEYFTYPTISLEEGDYQISMPAFSNAYLYITLMTNNLYTSQFATKIELNSKIEQTAEDIDIGVNAKLSNYSTTQQMNSSINLKANQILNSVSETYATKTTTNSLSTRIKQSAKSIDLVATDNKTSAGITIRLRNEDGTQIDSKTANITLSGLVKFADLSTSGSTTINGSNITTGTIDASKVTVKNLSATNIASGTLDASKVTVTNLNASNITTGTLSASRISGGSLSLTGNNATITSTYFNVTENGKVTITGNRNLIIGDTQSKYIALDPGEISLWNGLHSSLSIMSSAIVMMSSYGSSSMTPDEISAPKITQTSLAEKKKNFQKMADNALEILKNIDIYKYNLKSEKDTDKKHLGFVIGDGYNYSKEVTSIDNTGVDNYSFTSLCCKAIQELQKQLEEFNNEIVKLKGEQNGKRF